MSDVVVALVGMALVFSLVGVARAIDRLRDVVAEWASLQGANVEPPSADVRE